MCFTGGASGIGLALVKFFAQFSTKIAILDISLSASTTLLPSLQTSFPNTKFSFKKCDISNWEEQSKVFEEVYREFGSIDYVCANAGVSEVGKLLEDVLDDGGKGLRKPNLKTLDVNLVGNIYSTFFSLQNSPPLFIFHTNEKRNCKKVADSKTAIKLATHYMRKNTTAQKGSIICTASNAGLYPFPIAPLYGISKHAIVGAVRSLAKPLEADGIRINGVCPNCIGMHRSSLFISFSPLYYDLTLAQV